MHEMRVVAVGVDPRTAQPVLLLQETADQRRVLPVWVGLPEANAIELERQHAIAPRPLAHQLIGNVIDAFGRQLERVDITMVQDGVFYAELIISPDLSVSARVSDAVALALHTGVPIQAADGVLDEAGLADAQVIDTAAAVAAEETIVDQAAEVERFHEFLDDVRPEDFGKP